MPFTAEERLRSLRSRRSGAGQAAPLFTAEERLKIFKAEQRRIAAIARLEARTEKCRVREIWSAIIAYDGRERSQLVVSPATSIQKSRFPV